MRRVGIMLGILIGTVTIIKQIIIPYFELVPLAIVVAALVWEVYLLRKYKLWLTSSLDSVRLMINIAISGWNARTTFLAATTDY